ncbi:hypothetical protein [Burkholderia metallica]|uniref:hypothetical protein n=1 Tax=Burkholderia metallica TaxID=488729 RepID=UPI001CF314A6|nr:hypothetical protein [Burkholderia metallica]MCA8020423.1 hypothetical protein [Burkholderia metallica]
MPIVFGYADGYEGRAENSMAYFYEPLDESRRKTGKFDLGRQIGLHTDIAVFRRDVWPACFRDLAACADRWHFGDRSGETANVKCASLVARADDCGTLDCVSSLH